MVLLKNVIFLGYDQNFLPNIIQVSFSMTPCFSFHFTVASHDLDVTRKAYETQVFIFIFAGIAIIITVFYNLV